MAAFTDHFQDDLVARLALDPLFADVVIIQERKGSAATQIQQATAGELPAGSGKYGRFAIVEMPVRLPGEMVIGVMTRIIPKFIEAGADAHEIIWNLSDRVEQLFDQWSNGPKTLQVRNIVPYSDKAGIIGYDAEIFWTRAIEPLAAPELPAIRIVGTRVTLTCPTPDVAIYYTADGSFPAASNPAAALYAAPFDGASGALIRAAAFIDGQPGSGTARKRIP